ncbi:hypothetical protein BH20ACT4_BH20ACT4_06650 [soil metagenome]
MCDVTAIRPLDFDQLDPELRAAVRPRYERLGYLGDFFRHLAHQPRALVAFDALTEACKVALGPAHAETIALTVASRLENAYELHQHERLAVRAGLGRPWVADVERLEPDDATTLLDDAQRAVQRFAMSATESHSTTSAAQLDDVVRVTDEARAVAVALLTGRFVAHGVISRALDLRPAVPSIFEDGFDGR